MKKNILLASLFFCTLGLGASAEASLKKDMKQIGKLVKAISLQIEDASKNADSVEKLKEVDDLLKKTQEKTPDVVEKLSGEKQSDSLKKYKEMIQKELDLSAELQKALLANDNVKAKALLKDMNDVKKKGHQEFNPED